MISQKDFKRYIMNCLPNDELKDLLDIISIEQCDELIERTGGTRIYIIKKDTYTRYKRDLKIYYQYREEHKTVKELARNFRMSETTIRRILGYVEVKFNQR